MTRMRQGGGEEEGENGCANIRSLQLCVQGPGARVDFMTIAQYL